MRVGLVAILTALAVCLAVPGARAQADCANWKSLAFFETASAADVRACLRAGAYHGARGMYGFTSLHFAAVMDNAAAIAALLEDGAYHGARDYNGWTPLHVAAMMDSAAAIAALLDGLADPGARTKKGWTPLHSAARHGQAAAIAALLDGGANPLVRGEYGNTPFDLIPDDSPLVGTSAYWRLNNATWGGNLTVADTATVDYGLELATDGRNEKEALPTYKVDSRSGTVTTQRKRRIPTDPDLGSPPWGSR